MATVGFLQSGDITFESSLSTNSNTPLMMDPYVGSNRPAAVVGNCNVNGGTTQTTVASGLPIYSSSQQMSSMGGSLNNNGGNAQTAGMGRLNETRAAEMYQNQVEWQLQQQHPLESGGCGGGGSTVAQLTQAPPQIVNDNNMLLPPNMMVHYSHYFAE